ncbi:hypothetical protein QNH20_23755 [Neobacillus sp. WH10]|uniref:hypothetical protein n=1 Tax=Neobacillus sp. WH10 TaxID=3047873 RepID=UPI0024C14716|nr:hypothetical protein [Neobacillus sp. WH10]WHY77062.1 hypothetical protein QNH20_23755 [Neobacillus sp. WH10]
MKEKTKYTILNVLLIGTLLLNLFIFTSRMSFLPWFIEDAFGYAGVLITSPILLAIFFFFHRLQKNYKVTNLNKFIPLIATIISLIIVLINVTDFANLLALTVNAIMFIISCGIFIQHTDMNKSVSHCGGLPLNSDHKN